MTPLARIIETLEGADRAAKAATSIADHALGLVGRGAPRWHRWRALRLRLRAARLEARGEVVKAKALRVRAAIHMGRLGPDPHAMAYAILANMRPRAPAEDIALLKQGIEPEAMRG